MLRALQQLLGLSGQIHPERNIVDKNDQQQSPVSLVSQELIGLFAQIREHSRCGLLQERRMSLMELLQRFSEMLEITEVPGENRVIHIRPRQARFSALLILQAQEIDEEMNRIIQPYLTRQPEPCTPTHESAESPRIQTA